MPVYALAYCDAIGEAGMSVIRKGRLRLEFFECPQPDGVYNSTKLILAL
jgi:hypothetical protein